MNMNVLVPILGFVVFTAFKRDYWIEHTLILFPLLATAAVYLATQRHYRRSFVWGATILVGLYLQPITATTSLGNFLMQEYCRSRTAITLILAGIITHVTRNYSEKSAMQFVGFTNVLLTFMYTYWGTGQWGGAWDNRSINAAMTAVFFPYFSFTQMVVAILYFLMTPSRSPFLVLGIYIIVMYLRAGKTRWVFAPLTTGAAILAAWKFCANQQIFDRTNIWMLGVNHVLQGDWRRIIFGVGPGTWATLIPNLQVQYHIEETIPYTVAHNDFVQTFFEVGLVGLVALSWLISKALTHAKGEAFYAILGLVIMMQLQFPMEMPSTLFFLVFFVQRTLAKHAGSCPSVSSFDKSNPLVVRQANLFRAPGSSNGTSD